MFVFQPINIRVILLYVGLSQICLFTDAIQDGYDKCLFFRIVSSVHVPSKWDSLLAAYKQIIDSEHLRSNMGKRSLSTLAKNDDMPATHGQEGHNDGENGDSPYRYDEVDKKVMNKVSKYLQHVKRRNNNMPKSREASDTNLDTILQKPSYSTGANDQSNVKVLTEDYIFCNKDPSVETNENLRLLTLKEKLQDSGLLSIILNTLDNEQAVQMLNTFYPRVDKRFMGRIPEMGPRFTTPSSRRHGR